MGRGWAGWGTVAERFEAAMLAKLDQVSPSRSPGCPPHPCARPQLPALGPREGTAAVREKMGGVFLEVVRGAMMPRREAGKAVGERPLHAAPGRLALLVPRQDAGCSCHTSL